MQLCPLNANSTCRYLHSIIILLLYYRIHIILSKPTNSHVTPVHRLTPYRLLLLLIFATQFSNILVTIEISVRNVNIFKIIIFINIFKENRVNSVINRIRYNTKT